MNVKKNRQSLIMRIIHENEISTQEELSEKLSSYGINVTQATISRDLCEMGFQKANGKRGQVSYSTGEGFVSEPVDGNKYCRIVRDSFVSAEVAGTLLVIRTISGMAMAVAAALDNLCLDKLVGCIAGDDTIFAATHSVEEAAELKESILSIIF